MVHLFSPLINPSTTGPTITNAELLAKIREEVEIKYISTSDSPDRWDYGYDTACEEILSFLSALEEEIKEN